MNNAIETLKKVLKNSDDRRLLFNIAGNYFVKGGAMLVSLLMMPAYMHYFQSNTVLGMWFTVIQLLNWIMLLDFGVGGGLRNKIIEPLKHANKNRVISLISAAYISVFAIVLMLIIFQYVLVGLVDWYKLLGVSPFDIQADTLKYMVHILIIGVSIRFFCVLISQILYALQKAFLPGLLNLVSSFMIMIYLVFAEPKGDDTDIIALSYVNIIADNLPAIVATFWVFSSSLKGMGPRLSAFRWSVVKEVLSTGGLLFYLQIVLMLLFNVKEIYISWFIGAKEVVEYQIYYKLIGIFGGLYSLALTPIWSAITKAIVEQKYRWIERLYHRGLLTIIGFSGIQLLVLLFMPWIVKIWLGEKAIEISFSDGLIFCVYNVIYMCLALNYNFACGMEQTKGIAFWLTVAAVLNYFLTMWGCLFYPDWITVIAATGLATIPCLFFTQRNIFHVVRSMSKREKRIL